jgi:predicted transglutaminase-like cysteine proteinase
MRNSSRASAFELRIVSLLIAVASLSGPGTTGLAGEQEPQREERATVSPPRGPAQFFTINEILGNVGPRPARAFHLPLADNEPFGLTAFVQPEGLLWSRWRTLAAGMTREAAIVSRCIMHASDCTPAAQRFSAIVMSARERTGRAKLELVNQRINAAIRYKSDQEQWGEPDVWSAPLVTFATGFGDCEDYALAKYEALRESGVPAQDLRMVLGYDRLRASGHAILAVRNDGDWLVLDHLAQRGVPAAAMYHFVPLFSFNSRGVNLLAMPYIGHAMAAVAHTPLVSAHGGISGFPH